MERRHLARIGDIVLYNGPDNDESRAALVAKRGVDTTVTLLVYNHDGSTTVASSVPHQSVTSGDPTLAHWRLRDGRD